MTSTFSAALRRPAYSDIDSNESTSCPDYGKETAKQQQRQQPEKVPSTDKGKKASSRSSVVGISDETVRRQLQQQQQARTSSLVRKAIAYSFLKNKVRARSAPDDFGTDDRGDGVVYLDPHRRRFVAVPDACAICLQKYAVNDVVIWSGGTNSVGDGGNNEEHGNCTAGRCPHAFHSSCILDWLVCSYDASSTAAASRPNEDGHGEERGVPAAKQRSAAATTTTTTTTTLPCPCCRGDFVAKGRTRKLPRRERPYAVIAGVFGL